MVQYITRSFRTENRLVKIRISEGGYRKALTPISADKLKIEMRSMIGP